MTHSDDDFQIDGFDFIGQIIQLGFAFRLDNRFIKIEERISGISDFG